MIKWIIWDLGGVVINLNIKNVSDLLQNKYLLKEEELSFLMREEFRVDIEHYSPTEMAVAGLIDKHEYLTEIEKKLAYKVNKYEIEQIINSILIGENNDTIDIIKKINSLGKSQACMSNVDNLHWERILKFPNVSYLFEKKFLSFEQKLVKPHAAAYSRLLDIIDCPAQECIFIDDRKDNIDAALIMGFDAIQFHSAKEIGYELKIRNIAI